MSLAFTALIAFVIGSIPTGYFVGKLYRKDIREHGSGNIGATNAARVLGKKAGLLTLIGDLLKGVVSVMIVPNVFSFDPPSAIIAESIAGTAAVFGHCYSPFLKFKGGKGVATALGVFACLAPYPTLLAVVTFAGVAKVSGYVSIASLSSVIALVVLISSGYFQAQTPSLIIAAVLVGALIFVRHKSNILRLMRGEELSAKGAQ